MKSFFFVPVAVIACSKHQVTKKQNYYYEAESIEQEGCKARIRTYNSIGSVSGDRKLLIGVIILVKEICTDE